MIHEIKKTWEEWDVGLSKHETWNDGILFLPMFPPQGVQDITLKVCQLCNTLQYYTRMINLGREIVIIISYYINCMTESNYFGIDNISNVVEIRNIDN